MDYTVQFLEENYSIPSEDIEKYLKVNDIKTLKNGKLNEETFQGVIAFFDKEKEPPPLILNGSKPKEKAVFESDDKRIAIYQQDVIQFLKSLKSNSVDLIITDPAYSGMNQRLKLGSRKIIGKYEDRGEKGKWFEEFLYNETNYDAFLKECFRVMKNDRHFFNV